MMMKKLIFISEDKEKSLIQEMTYKLKMENLNIHPRDTCFLMVSPDYSAIATQHLSHSLTMDREIFHIESVNVPFPDEAPKDYKNEFNQNFIKWQEKWINFVLIEAGVIRGSNYTWITEIMKPTIKGNIHTIALCENIYSSFKSDFVSLYYDDTKEDIHFWWEQPNNHWKS
jgi:hypothetical protein